MVFACNDALNYISARQHLFVILCAIVIYFLCVCVWGICVCVCAHIRQSEQQKKKQPIQNKQTKEQNKTEQNKINKMFSCKKEKQKARETY